MARLEKFATERGHTTGQLAIAWLLSKPWVSLVIPGAHSPEQVTANVTASQWKLTPDEVTELDDITAA